MKKLIAFLLVLVFAMSLAACGCEHEFAAATCTAPSTCTLCGETEGAALGHVWMAATCEDPKTCEVCAATEGEAKGHALVEATCEEPKHCENCRFEEGDALGHAWLEATTDDPQTCETCGVTEGERIITDFRFTTEATREIQGKWVFELILTGEIMGDPSMEGEFPIELILDFKNNGDLGLNVQVTDKFMEQLIQYSVDIVYEEAALEGVSKEEVDAEFMDLYGMTLYDAMAEEMDKDQMNGIYNSLFDAADIAGVYYVDNGILYNGLDWEMMDPYGYELDGDTLTLKEFITFGEEYFDIVGKRLVTEE